MWKELNYGIMSEKEKAIITKIIPLQLEGKDKHPGIVHGHL